jgi:TIR domain
VATQDFDTIPSWEEVASNLPRNAKDTERLMAAMYYRFQYEKLIAQHGISSGPFQNTQPSMNNYENAVFVSYAWGGESERAVDELERAFDERGIRIIRDKKDLAYKGSIEAFEQRIGQGQCVVLVISDKYLRSEHCMYELVEVDKNRGLRERIFPIVLADARIYKAKDRLTYIKQWDEQIEQLNQAIKQVNVMTNLAGITADLDRYARIRANFDHLSDLLSDMNALTPEMHAASGFSTLLCLVERAMAGKDAFSQSDKVMAQPYEVSDNRSEQLHENTDASDVAVLADEYFRRARWPRPSNLAATANHCASKGWLSEVERSEGRKTWRITRKGYDQIQSVLNKKYVN